MSISRLTAAILALLPALVFSTPGSAATRPQVTCTACIVVDDTGRVLFAREPDARLPNASTTKIVTALLVREHAGLDEAVTVSAGAAATSGGGTSLASGDVYSVHDLLYALLLASSNDAAVALAEHVSGTEAAFVEEMNDTAGALGLSNTHFVTSHGLDAADHYSSPSDLADVADVLLADRVLAQIVRTTGHTMADGMLVENRNPLLETYAGAIGVKTGYTLGAGNVLVAAAVRDGRRVVAVAMNSVDAGGDAATLMDYGFERLSRGILLRPGKVIGSLVFDPAGAVEVRAGARVRGPELPSEVALVFEPGPVELPLQDGEVVGTVSVMAGERVVGRVDAVAASTLDERRPSWAADAVGRLLQWGHELAGVLDL